MFSVNFGDHFAAGLVALPVVGPLLLLLQQAIPHGFVLERKLADKLAKLFHFVLHRLGSCVPQINKKLAKP